MNVAGAARGARPLRDRIEAYTRYAALVCEQIQALDRDDLEAFAALMRQREALAQRIDGAGAPEPAAAPGGAGPESAAALRQVLERCFEADARLLERLRALRGEARNGLQHLEARRSQVEAYLTGGARPASLDVRS